MKRKLLAMLTALAMMLTLLPMTAFAEEGSALPEADANGVITLTEDTEISVFPEITGSVTIDLGGNTLTYTGKGSVQISNGASLTILNGTLVAQSMTDGTKAVFNVNEHSSAMLNSVVMKTNGSALYPKGDAAAVTVTNSKIFCGVYAVGTNANDLKNGGVVITLTNSEFISDAGYKVANGKGDGDSLPVMINVPGKLNMSGCTVKGTRQAVMVRGGNATIENCTIEICATSTADGCTYGSEVYSGSDKDKYNNSNWADGNNLPMGALIVGNRSTSYPYPATCSVEGTTITAPDGVSKVYTYAPESTATEDRTVTLTYDESISNQDVTNPEGSKAMYGNPVASVNGQNYPSLQAAIAAAPAGAEVKLMKDVELSTGVDVDKQLTLNLDGKTITTAETWTGNDYLVAVKRGGDLTITGNGYITYEYSETQKILTAVKLTIKGEATEGTPAKLTIDNGTLTGTYYVISGNGTRQDTEITINGGTLTSTDGTAIYHPQRGTLNVNGGSITGLQGIQFCAGTGTMGSEINVGGGKITAAGTDERASKTGDGEIPDGAAISVIDRNYPGSAPSVTINGGEFVSAAGNPVLAYTWASNQAQDWEKDTEHVVIEGGEFSASVAKYVDKTKLNYEAYSDMYTYHKTLDEALDAAGDKGTVTDLNPIADADEATVTLIDQGTKTTIKTTVGSEIELPTREDVGYNVFIAWVNDANELVLGGTEITVAAATETYTALYNPMPPYIPPVVSGNTVTTAPASNGYVTVNPANAAQNTVVTVTPVPSQGYVLSGLTVTDVNGMQVPVTANANGTYSFVMPAAPVTVSAAFAPEGPQTWTNPYADVADTAWYADAVAYVSAKGLMTGTSAVMFAPDASTTRAMIWTVLGRMSGASVDGGEPWYSLAQTWAMANGVSDGTNPNNAITREQLAAMLYRFAGEPDLLDSELAGLNTYADSADVSDWAQEAMAWAVSSGIINGIDGKLAPQGLATRAQVAAMLMRYCENVAK